MLYILDKMQPHCILFHMTQLSCFFPFSTGIARGRVTNFLYWIFISFLVSLEHIQKIEGGSTLRCDGESIVFWSKKVRFSLYKKQSKLSDHVDLRLIVPTPFQGQYFEEYTAINHNQLKLRTVVLRFESLVFI